MTFEDVILVDDDSDAVLSLARALKACGLNAKLHATSDLQKALHLVQANDASVAVVDLVLDSQRGVESGFSLISEINKQNEFCRTIVLTGHGSVEHGVRAVSLGAASFLEKPANVEHLKILISDALKQSLLRRELSRLQTQTQNSFLIGQSKEANHLRAEITYASQNNLPVLLLGETGTGKGLCALAIHKLSVRANQSFMRYQPTFSTADLVNSDLFGHKKGSFTGATEDRRGLLLESDAGTFFLDEIEELPFETQVVLLGVLQEKKVRAVGDNIENNIDFRLISAGNEDFERKLGSNKFRKDLFHRISHQIVYLPPLRDRKEDIPLLADYFLEKIREKENIQVLAFSENAYQKLYDYDWPGNVRQLEAVIEAAAIRANYDRRIEIATEDLRVSEGRRASDIDIQVSSKSGFHDQVRLFKLKLIKEKLSFHNGNQLRAAKDLGLDRSTLRRLLEL